MKRFGARAAVLLVCLPAGALAEPLAPQSAIPWLTESLAKPDSQTPDNTETPSVPGGDILVEVLGDQRRDGIGILTSTVTGLPQGMWTNVSALRARSLIEGVSYDGVPALRALFRTVLLAETEPPLPSVEVSPFLIARIDRLLDIGALEEAEALAERAGIDTAPLFRRWFDIGLLSNRADRGCAHLAQSPTLSAIHLVQVFCLARSGDWDAAAVALTVGERLGDISEDEALLLELFIDPALLEEVEPPEPSEPMTSLEFLIRESIGLPRANGPQPMAFQHADMAQYIPVRFRMEAGERLVRAGAVPSSVLFAAYREETPAASGGVWDRAAAVQNFDAATSGDEIAQSLLTLDAVLWPLGLRVAAARDTAPRLATLRPSDLPASVHGLVAAYLLMGGAEENAPLWVDATNSPHLRLAAAISEGDPAAIAEALDRATPIDQSIGQPFAESVDASEDALEEPVRLMLADGQAGEAILLAIAQLASDPGSVDHSDLTVGFRILRAAGLDRDARRIAVEMLLELDPA